MNWTDPEVIIAAAGLIGGPAVTGLVMYGYNQHWRKQQDEQNAQFKKWHSEHFDHAKDRSIHSEDVMPKSTIEAHLQAVSNELKQHAEEDRRIQRELREDLRDIKQDQAAINQNIHDMFSYLKQRG